jgi:hypothetical protein
MPHNTPWTPREDKLLGTAPDSVIGKRLKRTQAAVRQRRRLLNIAGLGPFANSPHGSWGTTELAMLGRYHDAEIARITRRSTKEVQAKRKELHGSK